MQTTAAVEAANPRLTNEWPPWPPCSQKADYVSLIFSKEVGFNRTATQRSWGEVKEPAHEWIFHAAPADLQPFFFLLFLSNSDVSLTREEDGAQQQRFLQLMAAPQCPFFFLFFFFKATRTLIIPCCRSRSFALAVVYVSLRQKRRALPKKERFQKGSGMNARPVNEPSEGGFQRLESFQEFSVKPITQECLSGSFTVRTRVHKRVELEGVGVIWIDVSGLENELSDLLFDVTAKEEERVKMDREPIGQAEGSDLSRHQWVKGLYGASSDVF